MRKPSKPLQQITVIYVATTLFLGTLSVYTFVQVRNLIDSFGVIAHTHQVNQSLQMILITLLEAETNKHGFLETKDSTFLHKRTLNLYRLRNQQLSLDTLLQGNAEQTSNFKQLATAIHKTKEHFSDIPSGQTPFQTRYEIRWNTHEEMQLMDSVREHIKNMTLIETQYFKHGQQQLLHHSLAAPLLIIILFLGALLILLTSYLKLQGELRYSQELLQQLFSQKEEKERQEVKLVAANQELRYRDAEREKRAEELLIANHKLVIQSQEKEKRAVELLIVNKDLQLFTQISSHDLKEPLRKLQMAASRLSNDDYNNLSEKGRVFFNSMRDAASTMQSLIDDLITYSETNREERTFVKTDLQTIIEEVLTGLRDRIEEKHAVITLEHLGEADIIPFQFRQLIHNILGNALKFSRPDVPPIIILKGRIEQGSVLGIELQSTSLGEVAGVQKFLPDKLYSHISISDNGIGFEPKFNEKIFEVFQRLHSKDLYKGTGIGLAIVKRIIENHNGSIVATGIPQTGARFDIYIPHQKL